MTPLDYFKQCEPQLFRFWDRLAPPQKMALENQLNAIDKEVLKRQKKLLQTSNPSLSTSFEPFNGFAFAGNRADREAGQSLIQKGSVGCLLLAGGQGTRLKHPGPKGTYPISVIRQKSLFQLCAEKVHAASLWANRPLQLSIMTSPENDEETRSFFQQNGNFGLQQSQLSFFIQGTLPFLDAEGHLFLKTPWELAAGPDGNGNSLPSFAQSGIMQEWMSAGVEFIHVILVDNPLADPFDAELAGYHDRQGAEITLKCTEKTQPEEKVGVLVKQNNHCSVVEYSELSDIEKKERRKDGRLKHCCANLSLFCFSLSFIQRMMQEGNRIPLHQAWKASQFSDEKGNACISAEPNAWKFETYIFDWLNFTEKAAALLYPRKECFAPLKNGTGPDSPETVKKALQERDRMILQKLTGLPPPEAPFELNPQYYYPTPALLAQLKGCSITEFNSSL